MLGGTKCLEPADPVCLFFLHHRIFEISYRFGKYLVYFWIAVTPNQIVRLYSRFTSLDKSNTGALRYRTARSLTIFLRCFTKYFCLFFTVVLTFYAFLSLPLTRWETGLSILSSGIGRKPIVLNDWFIDSLFDWLLACLLIRLIVRLIDWFKPLSVRLVDCSIDWLIGRLFVWLIDWLYCLIDWFIVRVMIDWLVVRFVDWLIDWLIGWLFERLLAWLVSWVFSRLHGLLSDQSMG